MLAWLFVWSDVQIMAQLRPLSLTVSCFSKIQIGFTFLVPAHPGSPGQRAVKRVCVSVCVCDTCLHKIDSRSESHKPEQLDWQAGRGHSGVKMTRWRTDRYQYSAGVALSGSAAVLVYSHRSPLCLGHHNRYYYYNSLSALPIE